MPKKNPKENANAAGGFQFNKAFGQHILKNPLLVQTIVDKSDVKSTDVVLEVGPGTGNLTVKLLEKAKKVIAVEYDPRMVAELQKRVMGTPLQAKLQIICGDVVKVDLPYFDLCVANIPYQVSSPLMFKLLSHRPLFRGAVLMVQREFAQRLCANPGDKCFSRLSLTTQLLAKCTHMIKVHKNNFRPPPKVDSSVIRIRPFDPPPPLNFIELDGLARICFNRKNKMLRSVFTTNTVLSMIEANYQNYCSMNQLEISEEPIKDIVLKAIYSVNMLEHRSRNMTSDEFLILLNAFNKANIHFA